MFKLFLTAALSLLPIAYAQTVTVTTTGDDEKNHALAWGPPIGWSANHGDICGDANDEDPTLALIHVGVPEGVDKVVFSGRINVQNLDAELKLVPGIFTLQLQPLSIGIAATKDFNGGVDGWQEFTIEARPTDDDAGRLLIPVFKIRSVAGPENSLAPNADAQSEILIDDLELTFDDETQLANGDFETGDLTEGFANFMNLNAWRIPECVSPKSDPLS